MSSSVSEISDLEVFREVFASIALCTPYTDATDDLDLLKVVSVSKDCKRIASAVMAIRLKTDNFFLVTNLQSLSVIFTNECSLHFCCVAFFILDCPFIDYRTVWNFSSSNPRLWL